MSDEVRNFELIADFCRGIGTIVERSGRADDHFGGQLSSEVLAGRNENFEVRRGGVMGGKSKISSRVWGAGSRRVRAGFLH